jgi:hypothetical protein
MPTWEDEVSILGAPDRLVGFKPSSESWEEKLESTHTSSGVVMWTFDACCSHLGGFILVQQRVLWKIHELTEGVVEDMVS